MTTTTDRIIAAANAVRTTHLAAALHLIAARPALDHTVTELLRELVAAGITSTKLARLLSIRSSTLTARLDAPAPSAAPESELHYGMFRRKDKLSVRAARESLITAAAELGRTYAAALRPISTVSQGSVPEAATVDAALEAVLHLHRSRQHLDAALDPILAALVLGGVRRMSLAEALAVHPNTLQRRLMSEPLAHARWADLIENGDGTWSVAPAEVGRYKPTEELDEALVEAAVAEAITAVAENGPSARAREYSATVAESRVAF